MWLIKSNRKWADTASTFISSHGKKSLTWRLAISEAPSVHQQAVTQEGGPKQNQTNGVQVRIHECSGHVPFASRNVQQSRQGKDLGVVAILCSHANLLFHAKLDAFDPGQINTGPSESTLCFREDRTRTDPSLTFGSELGQRLVDEELQVVAARLLRRRLRYEHAEEHVRRAVRHQRTRALPHVWKG